MAKSSSGSAKLYKSIFQARYKPQLDFYDLMIPASKEFPDFPQWQTDRLKVTLYDPNKHCSLALGFESFSFSQDTSDLRQEQQMVEQMLQKLPAKLNLATFSRLGIRRWYLTPVTMPFDALVAVLDVKLFAQNQRLKEIVPPNVNDLMYVTVNADPPCTARIVLGPVHDSEVPGLITVDQEHHLDPQKRAEMYIDIIKNYPKVSIYCEIDYFRAADEISIDDAKTFITTADARITAIATNLTEYLLSARVED